MPDGTIAPYDATKLMDAVRDRIKAEFIGLIPEDAWKAMVAAEVKKFFEAKPSPGYYENRNMPSDFQKTVWDELEKETRARMKTFLSSPEWNTRWEGDGKKDVSEAVEKIVVEKSGDILAAILKGAIQSTVEEMRRRI